MSNKVNTDKEMIVGNNRIGDKHKTYFIADIAANHDGDLERVKELIYLAADAGADAAKFQNFQAKTIVSDYGFKNLDNQISHQSKWEKSVFEVYADAALPIEWTETIKNTCESAGVDYFTSPYDIDYIDYLNSFVCAWKIGSGDITWHEELELLARGNKPIFIATGASTMDDVINAMNVVMRYTNDVVLMQCNTNYTASLENFRHIALNVLKIYAEKYPDTILGLSDHTPGNTTVLGAVALGASVIEKHFTDDIERKGPDHAFSMDPKSWREMVDRTRELEAALGSTDKKIMDNEKETVVLQRRAIRSKNPLKKGHVISKEDLVVLRPCPETGLPPYKYNELLGKRINRSVPAGDCIVLEDIS